MIEHLSIIIKEIFNLLNSDLNENTDEQKKTNPEQKVLANHFIFKEDESRKFRKQDVNSRISLDKIMSIISF